MTGESSGGGGGALVPCYQALKQAFDDQLIHQLTVEQFRVVINCCQKLGAAPGGSPPVLTELADILIQILASGRLPLDLQVLGSTAFALVLHLIQEPRNISLLYSKMLLPVEGSKDFSVRLTKRSELTLSIAKPDSFHLCLSHGLLALPDSFWRSDHLSWNSLMYSKLFPLFEKWCFLFDPSLTLCSFRCLVAWLKWVGLAGKPSRKAPLDILKRCLHIVLSSWESPLNGVREQNSLALEQLLMVLDLPLHQTETLGPWELLSLVLAELSWLSKSKYFLLAGLLAHCGPLKVLAQHQQDLQVGLTSSLGFSHLAPAGADLYKVCLEAMSLEQWQDFFLQPILTLLTTAKYSLSVQNVFNYWMTPTVRRHKGSLQLVLEGLQSMTSEGDKDFTLPAILCLKLGRREGLAQMTWPLLADNPVLLDSLRSADELVRTAAFHTLCISSKAAAPTDEEFTLLEEFLMDNVNSDCTPLRQNLLSSFSTFICRLRDACSQLLKTKYRAEVGPLEDRVLTKSMIFLEWLYYFLKSNLEIGSNYQRKITSLELYKVVLGLLADAGMAQRRNSLKAEGNRVMKYAIAVGKWSFTSEPSREILLFCLGDQSSDVREAAGFLLRSYFKVSEQEAGRFGDLFKKALQLCSDPMFYYSDSGALLVSVLTSLAYKNGGGFGVGTLCKEDRVSSCLLAAAELQASSLKEDILHAAAQGSPVHGVLSALLRLLTDPKSPEEGSLTAPELEQLLILLENLVSHLLALLSSASSALPDFAPSYSEIGEAIESWVERSKVTVEEADDFHLSPAYQLVLNCIWLNLRVCCQLASGLVTTPGQGLTLEDRRRCLALITQVLRSCRHKGALETAGTALGSIVRVLASPGSQGGGEALVGDTLAEALDLLALPPSPQSPYTSRGAGPVLLIHRIVANDCRPSNPSLGVVVGRVLEGLSSPEEPFNRAQALHLCSLLVLDSGLSQEMARYTHKILHASFNFISHSQWDVRNAGLQLLGALVPKVVGQRKTAGADGACSCFHLPYEELYLHSRPLVEELASRLGAPGPLPALTLLANMGVGLSTIVDRSLETGIYERFIQGTDGLMGSRVAAERRLAAQANAWFCSTSQLPSLIQSRISKIASYIMDKTVENEIKSENKLHGFLMNTAFLVERFRAEVEGNGSLRGGEEMVEESLQELRKVRDKTRPGQVSWVSLTVLAELCGPLEQAGDLAALEGIHPGLPWWARTQARLLTANCPETELPALARQFLNAKLRDVQLGCMEAVQGRTLGDPTEVVETLLEVVTSREDRVAAETLLGLLEGGGTVGALRDECRLREVLETSRLPLRLRVPLICWLEGRGIGGERSWEQLASLAAPAGDEDDREAAARTLLLLPVLSSLSPPLWATVLALLQDEAPSVRYYVVRFLTVQAPTVFPRPLNPSLCLRLLFQPPYPLPLSFPQFALCLWDLLALPGSLPTTSSLNPFTSSPNPYLEPAKLAHLAFNCLSDLIASHPEVKAPLLEEAVMPSLKDMRERCHSIQAFSSSEGATTAAIVPTDWYLTVTRLSCQFRALGQLNEHISETDWDSLTRFSNFSRELVFMP